MTSTRVSRTDTFSTHDSVHSFGGHPVPRSKNSCCHTTEKDFVILAIKIGRKHNGPVAQDPL